MTSIYSQKSHIPNDGAGFLYMAKRTTIRQRTAILFLAGLLVASNAFSQIRLDYTNNRSPEWHEVIEWYAMLDSIYPAARLIETGTTDAGKPLHLFIISTDGLFEPGQVRAAGKRIILINNGIHPGESNGIDASLEFAAEVLAGNHRTAGYLENTVLLIVPVFNVGGALNRSPYHRTNQNGPEEHGFRANARNLDLNRDFVKMDTRNARSLARTIHAWDPDIFVDTHSTNGADYPYTVTLIASHPQQLEEPQSTFMQKVMEPVLNRAMNDSPYKMCRYVNVFRTTPDQGFEGFIDTPRYLAGYTTFFQILAFTVETHMLKPYHERVLSTKYFLEEIVLFTHNHAEEIARNKQRAIQQSMEKTEHVLRWENDKSHFDNILFRGYRAKTRTSEVTGLERLYYDREDVWQDSIPFYNDFTPVVTVEKPGYYIIPSAWQEVIERLQCSGISMEQLPHDTTLLVDIYHIEDFNTTQEPYSGHYWHYNTTVRKDHGPVRLYAGDYMVPVCQRGAGYIVQTLEPQGYDSFFSWNFFDAVLSRNEYFSPYLFEETAASLLKEDPGLRARFMEKREADPAFSADGYAQLRWIYEHSPWSEPTYRRYPVYRYNVAPID
ncbi:MAG: M14 family zinc carboxypeptidase [Bacteroidales bacterium]|nr:M14 family zinc carboxypeptidase [Bacteroidales bacterium]